MLVRVIEDIEAASSSLFAMTGKIGQHLRENEWLMQIKQRTSIPGGTCEFDLPHYHHWQHRPAGHRVQDLRTWITPLLPIRSSVRLVLGLLRQSGSPLRIVANKGLFQQNLGGRVVQMVRIQVVDEAPEVPEVSANRLALNIRFTVLTEDARPRVAETNVDFELTFCSL